MATILTEEDIEMIKETRKEIVNNRQTLITIAYTSVGEIDDVTGEEIGGVSVERDVLSVVTEISSNMGANHERLIIGGVVVEKGDLWLSISIEQVIGVIDDITRLRYGGKWYAIMALDKKGIGEINRVEVVGRLES